MVLPPATLLCPQAARLVAHTLSGEEKGNKLTTGPRMLSYGERDRLVLQIAMTSYPQDCTVYGGKAVKVHKCHSRRIEEQPMTHGGLPPQSSP